jgi:hypothetical protein
MLGPKAIVLLVVAAISTAGCTQAGTATKAAATDPQGVADANTEHGGNIHGLVSDEEVKPIRGAIVAIENNLTVATDAEGRFQFLNVAPGTHRVIAQALGYQSTARNVVVQEGATVDVVFSLGRLAISEPYHEFFALVGFACLQTYSAVGRFTFGNYACPNPPASVIVQFNATKGVQTIVSEMTWVPTSALSAHVLGLDLWQGGVRTGLWTCDYCYGTAQGPSPVILRADGPFEGINGEKAAAKSTIDNIIILRGDPTFAGQFGLIYSQKVNIYTSVFYGAKAPEKYTGLPDA